MTGFLVGLIALVLIIICLDIIDPNGRLFQVESDDDDE